MTRSRRSPGTSPSTPTAPTSSSARANHRLSELWQRHRVTSLFLPRPRLLAPSPGDPLVERLEAGAQHVVEGRVVLAGAFRAGLGDEPSAACGLGCPGAGGEQCR